MDRNGGGGSDPADVQGQAKDAAFRPRFMEVPTFLRLPLAETAAGLDIALSGIPFDLGVTNRPGTRHGPRQVRDLSSLQRTRHPTMNVEPEAQCRLADLGDVKINPFSIEDSVARIQAFYDAVRGHGARPLTVGGDHLTTLPVLRALKPDAPMGLIQFDAHCDTGGPYMGQPLHHGATFKLAVEEGLLDPKRCVQIGIRGSLSEAGQWRFSYDSGMTVVPIEAYFDRGWRDVIQEARAVVGDGPVYVSFDVDGLDPIYTPGTGTPEPGGLPMHEAQRMIRALQGLDVVGADVVEVSPPFDPTGNTAMVAGTILFELLCIMADRLNPAP
ncbi:agmatinase [Rhodovibrio salinarum]|uniref:Agmatinase n=1 Tax=Rhodovibrio salinarum TaxID=1087 RepID=A0A934QKJ2_9PROT|nr:agmatinase [Rhodovibrio salinarum]MBK1698551.1 agmatinase [Rhodovibrio salinarum]